MINLLVSEGVSKYMLAAKTRRCFCRYKDCSIYITDDYETNNIDINMTKQGNFNSYKHFVIN